ncbi:hypothetical protein QAD02_000225 [Eretmocerus hayati]|uniref:Uncharacterized protein n=1 Tax=Eretmocerus hayati TaxID=131215 RepID=A0ACC2NEE2_9HYME|nr:hypothetical protein QAD02_000225 [Eretmocerus hayati]
MATIRPGEPFTMEQLLNTEGFTLDTTDFVDLLDDDDDTNYAKNVQLSNEEMMRLLNLEDDVANAGNEEAEMPFVGISFDTIRPKMESIYGDGQVLKLIKKEGTGDIVPPDAQVTVEYVGYFEYADEPFDSTTFQRDGPYGKLGCPPRIPENAEILFKIELTNFIDNGQADAYDDLDQNERKKFSSIQKIVKDILITAKEHVDRQKTRQAIREYTRARNYLETAHLENDQEEAEMNKHLSRACGNLLILYTKEGKPKLACAAFNSLPTKTSKSYFHYGRALYQLGEYDEAMKALQKSRNMETNDAKIAQINIDIQKVEVQRQKYLMYSRQFAQNSLKLNSTDQNNVFEKVALEMCENFLKDDSILKQEIPNGLSVEEQACIRRVAASKGLSITKQERFGSETSYLTKKSYYSRDFI